MRRKVRIYSANVAEIKGGILRMSGGVLALRRLAGEFFGIGVSCYAFATTSPASRKCVFRALRILQLTTLYSGHMASESLTLLVMMLSMISGKWKVLLSPSPGHFGDGTRMPLPSHQASYAPDEIHDPVQHKKNDRSGKHFEHQPRILGTLC